MREIIISALLFYTVINLNAQVGINTTNPKTTFDVQYSGMNTITDGVRAPLISLKDLSEKGNSLYGVDQKGTIIYVTDINGDNTGQRININKIGYYFFDGTRWNALGLGSITTAPTPKIGTIKDSFIKTDHEGWYLLDGRALTLLTNSVKISAESVGINSNLPDATDKMMITASKIVDIGMNGGKNGLKLEKKNLPNFTINSSNKTITTKEDGEHSHIFSGSSYNTEHSHQVNGYSSLGGDHTHNFGGYSTYTAHTHGFSITSSSDGSHGHVYKGPADSHNGRYNITADAEWDITTYEYEQTGRAGSHIHQVINTTSDLTSSGYSNHTHSVTNTSTSYGGSAHTHYFNGSTDYNSFNHNHAATVNNVSATNAAHTFTANILGSLGEGEAINNRSEYVAVNKFIYLGF